MKEAQLALRSIARNRSSERPSLLGTAAYMSPGGMSSYDIHPDGDRFLMVAPGAAQSQEIQVVLN